MAGLPIVATPASGGVADLLRGRHGAWLASEISTEALAATIIAALETVRTSERFFQTFFASSAGVMQKALAEAGEEGIEHLELNLERK